MYSTTSEENCTQKRVQKNLFIGNCRKKWATTLSERVQASFRLSYLAFTAHNMQLEA